MSRCSLIICVSVLVCGTLGQRSQQQQSQGVRPTPVPILKQINRANDDGSYTYGYEAADGSFKIETKSSTGEVRGKYGFVDDAGQTRTIEYGADRHGFQPSGVGIEVAPPTIHAGSEEDDGSYRPDKYGDQPIDNSIDRRPLFDGPFPGSVGPAGSYSANLGGQQRQLQQPQRYFEPQQPQYQPQQYQQQPQQQYQPQQYQPQPQARQASSFRPVHQQDYSQQFIGHPATNFDYNTGSYSVSYQG